MMWDYLIQNDVIEGDVMDPCLKPNLQGHVWLPLLTLGCHLAGLLVVICPAGQGITHQKSPTSLLYLANSHLSWLAHGWTIHKSRSSCIVVLN